MDDAGFAYFTERDPSFIALVEPDGTEWSRERLRDLVHGLAKAFGSSGLSSGDAVAIVAPNCAQYVAACLAGIEAGLYVVPVNWHLARSELAFVLEDSGARAIVAHERLGAARLAAIAANRGRAEWLLSIGEAAGFVPLEELVEPHSPEPPKQGVIGRIMPYTSATTGRPRGVKLPLGNARTALERIVRWHRSLGVELEDGNVHLCASMLYHSAPLEGATTALQMGHRLILVDHWQPELLLERIDRHAVTTTFMVPTMFVRLLKLPESVRARYSTASLRFVVHGGAPCPVDVKWRMLEWWGDVVWEAYGAAEGQGVIVGPAEWRKHPGTVGRPIAGAAVRVLDEDGCDLPPYEAGAIYLRPHTGDRFEYKGDPEGTRASYRGDFITVGDVGYLNEDGYLFVCDRKTDLILSSGMNIYPAEIETVLVQHAAVADCAVLGVEHAVLGQVPKAYVQVEPGVEPGPGLTADLLRYLGGRLSAMKLPRRVEYVATIPRDPSGKLRRRALRGNEAPTPS